MTTNDTNALAALDAHTRAMIEATQRRLADAATIKSPRELGITPDRSRNGMRIPRSQRHRAIR